MSNSLAPLCIFHAQCADGFTAAWVVRKALGEDNVEFFPGVYQKTPPLVVGRDVIFVDFCYKREVMLDLAREANSILVLDHHKSAMLDMKPASIIKDGGPLLYSISPTSSNANWADYFADLKGMKPNTLRLREKHEIWTCFDMNRSGAGLAWDFFFPGQPRPRLVDHVEDRDLWRFKLYGTREIQASIFSYPYDFDIWTELVAKCEDPKGNTSLWEQGSAIERKHFKDLHELLKVVTRPMRFEVPGGEGHPDGPLTVIVPVANLPYTFVSDAGHLLCEDHNWFGYTLEEEQKRMEDGGSIRQTGGLYHFPFAACYYDGPDGRNFSLRSEDGGADVSEIARLYGGGGHARAAGFRVPYDRLQEFEV